MNPSRSLLALVLSGALPLGFSGAPQALAASSSDPGYRFSRVQRNGLTPVALTCQAHPVLVNTNGHDPNLLSQAQRAITDTASAAGLNLFYAGTTSQTWASPKSGHAGPEASADPDQLRRSFGISSVDHPLDCRHRAVFNHECHQETQSQRDRLVQGHH